MKTWYQKNNHILYYNFQYGPENPGFIMDYDLYSRRKGSIIKNLELYNIYEIETEDDFPVEIIDSSIKILKFNYMFNQNIAKLPSHIEEIHFCNGDTELCHFSIYNKPIDYLQYGIKRLYLNYEFDQELLNLPESLEYLEIKGKFNKSLDFLPKSVKEIHIRTFFGADGEPILSHFNQPLNNLPENLEVLELECLEFNNSLDNLPKKLKCFTYYFYSFDFSLYSIPERLKSIITKTL